MTETTISTTAHRKPVGAALFDLHGTRTVVTGASRGLGRELAVGLAAFGAHVACVARNEDDLAATRAIIADSGGTASIHPADLSDPQAIGRLVDSVRTTLGGIDVLVNNAGSDIAGAIEKTTVDDWQRVTDLNARAAYLLCREAAPALKAPPRGGKVINVSSILGQVGIGNDSGYVMSKHAILGLTRALALEWAAAGVQVNALCPGFLRTDMTADVARNADLNRWVLDRTPAGRWGETSDFVGAAVFLASRASDFMTGQTLVVDGGWTAQ